MVPDGPKPGVIEGDWEPKPGVCGEPKDGDEGEPCGEEGALPKAPLGAGDVMPDLPSSARRRSSRLFTVLINSPTDFCSAAIASGS